MADPAFVVITLAAFALVALVSPPRAAPWASWASPRVNVLRLNIALKTW